MKYHNAAGRLYEILHSLYENSRMPLIEAIAKIFEHDPNDSNQLIIYYAGILELVNQVESEIQDLDNNEIYLNLISHIKTVLASNFDLKTPASELTGKYYMEYQGLMYLADTLNRLHPQISISNDQLHDLLQKVTALHVEVLESDIPQDLKELILDNLNSIRIAIEAYKLYGPDGLRKAMERGLGSYIMYRWNNEQELTANTKAREKMNDFATILSIINGILTLSTNARPLIEPVKRFLGITND